MTTAIYRFGENSKHEMRVTFGLLGFEEYIADDKLLKRQRTFRTSGSESFLVGEHRVTITVAATQGSWSSKAFVDGKVCVDDLFPKFARRVQAKRYKPTGWRRFIVNFILWLLVGFGVSFVYSYFKQSTAAGQSSTEKAPNAFY